MSTYLWVNIGAISIPLIFSFTKWFPFHREWRYFFPALLMMAIPFLLWDIWFTDMGVWGFNEKHLMGITIAGLPLEEYMFFICIPYACVFTYYVLRKHLPDLRLAARPICWLLVVMLAVAGYILRDRWYPLVTFLSLAVFLLLLLRKERNYLNHFLLMYLITLVPFFIVNGILTGSWISEEVVWYNNSENIGYRLGTIPIEDTMYGFLMLLMTVAGMEWLKERHRNRAHLKTS
ncbi:MAG: lycopene cyclase domain-containing protein [Saprospiraceae bacterium]|nr:lycopene cyclase domain-containing protein [Saprospiraceae bacterium]